ncbi:gliding motility lipoprotein GldD [Maribacter sp. 2307ULW6-5]|uniref:gliding motility lipoprotein GldD n=1 Tax=Maribacter sp. 2307ULW6-5 TaxID=3386275 RepID=UPI0039BD7507
MKSKGYFMLMMGLLLLATACQETPVPKPKAQLRLDYPAGKLAPLETENFAFSYNAVGQAKMNGPKGITISYPEMKGAIFLSYRKVGQDLETLIRDAKKLSYEHAAKAFNIMEQPYVNPEKKVYGSLFVVEGNAASQSQFFVTDSTEHFMTGAIYFESRPNYDSILPAATYLENDVRNIIETLEWR